MDEYLDIVDKNGNLTGAKELRSICHEKGLWHQTVHIFLVHTKNSSIYFLVHLRSKEKASQPNKWAIPFGGHVEAGDSIQATFVKELWEETGLLFDENQFISAGMHTHEEEKNKECVHMLFLKFDEDESKLKFNDGEVQAARWMKSEDIKNEIEKNPAKWANSMRSYNEIIEAITPELKT